MSVLVTLTTDFGEREPTVAEMKGIIFSGSPSARVVDLGHDIARGDVMETALFVFRSIPRFPAGTIHLVNVAPDLDRPPDPRGLDGQHAHACAADDAHNSPVGDSSHHGSSAGQGDREQRSL